MSRSITAFGWIGVGLILLPLYHNPDLWRPDALPTHAELCSLISGFLLATLDFRNQMRD